MNFISLIFILGICSLSCLAYRNVCYYGSWSVYRYGLGKFIAEKIDPLICTHIIYAFVGLNEDGTVRLLDAWNDAGDEWHEGAFTKLQKLKKINPDVKLLLAVGGWNEGSEKYSKVMNDPIRRSIFIDSSIQTVKQHHFDGFDLDWEYPTQRGGSPSDKQTFSQLLREMRPKFDESNLLLSAAVSCNPAVVDEAYEVPQLSEYLDFINVMTYDIHGSWDKQTGHNAPLFASGNELSETGTSLSVKNALEHWIARGSDPQKLNMGLATYGRSFTLVNSNINGVGAPASGPGTAGNFVGEGGFLAYNEICYEQKQNLWQNFRDDEQKVPYSVKGTKWVGYDDVRSITEKVAVVKELGLGGAMFWSIETDDFDNICGLGKYPLINAAVTTLGGLTFDQSQSTTTEQEEDVTTGYPVTTTQKTTTVVPTSSYPTTSKPSTTTNQPTTIIPEGTFNPGEACRTNSTNGYVRDPADCSRFYQCQPLSDRTYKAHNFKCSSGLVFDLNTCTCNYSNMVQC